MVNQDNLVEKYRHLTFPAILVVTMTRAWVLGMGILWSVNLAVFHSVTMGLDSCHSLKTYPAPSADRALSQGLFQNSMSATRLVQPLASL